MPVHLERHVLCFLLLLLSALQLAACDTNPVAEVVEVLGDVRLDGELLASGQVELSGEVIAGNGRAAIELANAGTLRIFPNTRTSIREGRTGVIVRLMTGRLWAVITKLGNGNRFEIETDNATAGVRGTEYVVEREGTSTEVRVISGEVEVKDEDGNEQVVKTGQRSTVEGSNPPSRPRRYDVDLDRELWRKTKGVERDLKRGVGDLKKQIDDLMK